MAYLDYSYRNEHAPIPAENCADEGVSSGELWVRMWQARRERTAVAPGLGRHDRLSQEANRLYFELVMRGDVQMPIVPQQAASQAEAHTPFPVVDYAEAA